MRNIFIPIIAFIVLFSFTGAFAQTPTPDADLNGDGTVDEGDLLLLLGQWHVGEPYTPTVTPTIPPVDTATDTPTATATDTPTITYTPTNTRTKTPTNTPTSTPVVINLPHLPVGAKPLEFVRIPAGNFQMGSPDTERGRKIDEGPVHTVNIGYGFYMGKYEVTQAQWQAVMGSNPASGCGVGNDYPVYCVSWDDCQTFITNLNRIAGGGFRLPSEAEWEYACRAGTTTRFYFGNSLGCDDYVSDCAAGALAGMRSDYMWYCDNNLPHGAKPVGGKIPNAFGLYDMSGNLYEFCEDYWHDNYTGAPTNGSAWVSPTSSFRVVRGGYWNSPAGACRSALRDYCPPYLLDTNKYLTGFRLSRTR